MSTKRVSVQVPSVASYLSLLRTVVGGCAGREGFTLDQIEDVKMAVDEAAAQLLSQLGDTADAQITLSINAEDDAVDLEISAPAAGNGPVIDPSSFSWTILQALSDELDASRDGTVAKVTMRKFRTDQDAA